MTLCICWREDEHTVHFASDSRLNLGGNAIDIGAKVLRVDARIEPAVPARDGSDQGASKEPEPTYSLQLGFAVAGGALAALTLVDALGHLLRRLQYGPMDPSMDSVAMTVMKFFNAVRSEFVRVLFDNGEFMFALGGRCPVNQRTRVFKFDIRLEGDGLAVDHEEVLRNQNDVIAFGSGRKAYEKRSKTGASHLDALKDVMEAPACPTVGGFVQYGRFGPHGHGFQLMAVHDYRICEAEKVIKSGVVFRGLPLYGTAPQGFEGGLAIPQRVLDPFRERLKDFDERGFAFEEFGRCGGDGA